MGGAEGIPALMMIPNEVGLRPVMRPSSGDPAPVAPVAASTLAYMLRMTGELREASAMGLRTVLRPDESTAIMLAGSEERASSSHHHAGDQAAEVMEISSPEEVSVNSSTIYMIILTI